MYLWSIPSPGLELILLDIAGMVFKESYGMPLLCPSWCSGSECGWIIGIPWNPNFICPKEWPLSPVPLALPWSPTEGTLTEEDKLWGPFRETPCNAESSSGLIGALTACRSWGVLLSKPDVIDPRRTDPGDTDDWVSIYGQKHYASYIQRKIKIITHNKSI